MAKRKDSPIIEEERQYLLETQEYIKRLKDNLIRKILALQQNKKAATTLNDSGQKTNTYNPEKFLSVAEEKISV